jgi:hypothetical protein
VGPDVLPSVGGLEDAIEWEHAGISLGDGRQIGGLCLELSGKRPCPLAVNAVAHGATRLKLGLAEVGLLGSSLQAAAHHRCDRDQSRQCGSSHGMFLPLIYLNPGADRRVTVTSSRCYCGCLEISPQRHGLGSDGRMA